MQLTRFTDFCLRVLMYLCTPAPDQREQAVKVAEIAGQGKRMAGRPFSRAYQPQLAPE